MSDYLDWRVEDFPYQTRIETRWGDNDMRGHPNNVAYNRMIETVVVRFTMGPLAIDWQTARAYPLVVESLCRFHRPLAFPETITAGLRAGRLGGSSVTYEIGLFGEGNEVPGATGHFIHVFIDRDSQKSVQIPDDIREGIQADAIKG